MTVELKKVMNFALIISKMLMLVIVDYNYGDYDGNPAAVAVVSALDAYDFADNEDEE